MLNPFSSSSLLHPLPLSYFYYPGWISLKCSISPHPYLLYYTTSVHYVTTTLAPHHNLPLCFPLLSIDIILLFVYFIPYIFHMANFYLFISLFFWLSWGKVFELEEISIVILVFFHCFHALGCSHYLNITSGFYINPSTYSSPIFYQSLFLRNFNPNPLTQIDTTRHTTSIQTLKTTHIRYIRGWCYMLSELGDLYPRY